MSTVDDYWAFVSMLLQRGSVGGTRILTADSVARMTTDQLTAAQRAGNAPFLGEHDSWGYAMAAPAAGATGEPLPCGFGWEGGSGTTWRTSPGCGVTGILLTQRQMMSPEPPAVFRDFWAGVNAALG